VKNISLTKLDFEVNWEVENNNNFSLDVKDFTYNLAVNSSQWAAGKIAGAPVIAANKKTAIPLTISLNSLSMVRDITAIIARGTEVAYACNGNISMGGGMPGLSDFNQPFNFNGAAKLRK
jgi:LEA14-like dessication related protein